MEKLEAQEKSALMRAYDIQQAAAEIGFTWASPQEAMVKVHEELGEFVAALEDGDRADMKKEAGDILYAIVNVLRLADINPEEAMACTAEKFERRLNGMRDDMIAAGIDYDASPLALKVDYWIRQKAKDPDRQATQAA